MSILDSEKNIEEKFCELVESYGWDHIKLKTGGPYGRAGYPDRLVLKNGGDCFFVELKRPGGKIRIIQHYRIRELRRRGYRVYVWDNVEQIESGLRAEILRTS